MNICPYCHVAIADDLLLCPLCHVQVSKQKSSQCAYPPATAVRQKRYPLSTLKKALFLCVVALSIVCITINLLTVHRDLWSALVSFCLFYLYWIWLLVSSKRFTTPYKFFLSALSLNVLLVGVDVLCGYPGWSLSVVTPFLIAATTLSVSIFCFVKRVHWRQYLLFLILLIFLGFLPILLFLFGVIKSPTWPSFVSAIYALITFLAMLLFGDRSMIAELKKRFHI